MKMIAHCCLFFLLCVISLRCSSPNDADGPLRAPGFSTPVVTGIYVTTIDPTVIAVWGHPVTPQSQKPGPVNVPDGYYSSIHSGQAVNGSCDTTLRMISLDRLSHMMPIDGVPRDTWMAAPYPNPFAGSVAVTLSISRETTVSLWVVRARWIGDVNNDVTSSGGAVVISPQVVAIAELILRTTLSAGYYRAIWNGKDMDGQNAPAGFYRIYFQGGESISWYDVLLYREFRDLPGDLQKLFRQ